STDETPYYDFSVLINKIRINNINTAMYSHIAIGIDGCYLGDANGDGVVGVADAIAIARFLRDEETYPLSGNGQFYGEVTDNGDLQVADAIAIARYGIGRYDANYQPVSI
ncbi:MAG: hypothetical protein PHF57_12820, partial [Methanoregula sp.]|nr:hypothetical protein [Methanoregula sp.]